MEIPEEIVVLLLLFLLIWSSSYLKQCTFRYFRGPNKTPFSILDVSVLLSPNEAEMLMNRYIARLSIVLIFEATGNSMPPRRFCMGQHGG